MPNTPDPKHSQVSNDLVALGKFLVALGEDPTKAAAFAREPDKVLRDAGVPPELGEVVKSGSSYINARLAGSITPRDDGDNNPPPPTVTVVVVVIAPAP